jgi:NADPH:quinone reductase-like Zn-dependent oxidoreductase
MKATVPPSYLAMRISASGGPEVLLPTQISTTNVGHTQVLIKVARLG